MIWQFGELGYDYSINYCPDGTINPDCRTSAKPVRWDYRDVAERFNVYKVVSALNEVKKTNPIFSTTDFDIDLGGLGKRLHLNTADLKATIVGNFNVVPIDMVPGFQHTGPWYDFFGGNTIDVTDLTAAMNFQPGEYHVYFDQPLFAPDTALNVAEAIEVFGFNFMVYPNPASDRVSIGFRNNGSQKVSIDLLDISGRLVETIDSRNYSTGVQSIEWSCSHVPQGTYFVRIQGEHLNESHPLIISH
jgi:hypothetical protein